MSDNIPKLTEANLPDDGYFIVRMCIHCQDMSEDTATPFPMPFPSLRLAKANMLGMIEDAVEDTDQNACYENGIVTMVDDDGEEHRYIQAVIKITNKIVWRPGDDEQLASQFNDIISAIDFDTSTE